MLTKKYTILILSFLVPFSMQGMQVIEPYKPSILTQYPTITKIGSSLLVATGVTALTIGSKQEISSDSLKTGLFIGTTAFCGAYIYQKYFKKPNILDSLLTNPQQVLEYTDQTCEACRSEVVSKKLDTEQETNIAIPKIKDLIQKYEKKCPLFFIRECTTSYCPFTRSNNPHFRAAYETKINSLLLEKIQQNPEKIIHSVHFGCGGALSDIVIITKTLVQQPNAKLHIHLIDGHNTSYINMQDYFNKTHEIKANQSFEWNDCYIAHLKQIAPNEVKDMSDKQIERQLVESNLLDEIKYQQFIRWLQYTFPNATLSLSIHSNQENYFNYIQNNNIPYADVITSADIQDEMSMMRASTINYTLLCKKTLQHNPSSSNIWLGHNHIDTVGLLEISLEKPNDFIESFDPEEKGSPVYLSIKEKL